MVSKATAKNVDFSNVKEASGIAPRQVPAGDYLAQIVKVEDAVSKKDDAFQYLFTIKLKKFSNNSYPYYCKLQENQLWKLRNLAIAAGLNVPKKRLKFDPNKVVGKTIGVTMEDDEYEGKPKSQIAAVFPAAELTDGADPVEDDDNDNDGEDEAEEVAVDIDDEGVEDTEEESEDEDTEEESEDEEEGEDTRFADYDRTKLKREIKKLQSDFSVKKSMSDDDLRVTLRELTDAGGKDSSDDDDELEELDLDNL